MKAVYHQIISLVKRAQELASSIGIANILQPGLVKEMVMADILGHQLIFSKRDADACDAENPNVKYECLSCFEGGSGQLDRMFKEPLESREQSLQRIRRNSKIYLAVFYKNAPLKAKVIYEIEPIVLENETVRQLERSRNIISHVGFSGNWAKQNRKVVYLDEVKKI